MLVERWQIQCSKRVLEGVQRTTDQEVCIYTSQRSRKNSANGHWINVAYQRRVNTTSMYGSSERINECARKGYPVDKTYLESQKAFRKVSLQGVVLPWVIWKISG